jgi:hypothetical protein
VLSCLDGSRGVDLGDGICVQGRFAVVSTCGDVLETVYLVGGTRVETPRGCLEVEAATYGGEVVDFSRDEVGRCWLEVRGDLPAGSRLEGAQVRVLNDGAQDACYPVQGAARRAADVVCLDLGDTTLVRGLADPTDYAGGLVHNIEVGERVEVPTEAHLTRRHGRLEAVQATAEFTWVE